MKKFTFEIYTKNPATGENGWSIKFVTTITETKQEAINRVNSVPDFDCIITADYCGDVDLANLTATDYIAYNSFYIES